MKEWLRLIPPVHELQNHKSFQKLASENNIETARLTNLLKEILEDVRSQIILKQWNGVAPGTAQFVEDLFQLLETKVMDQFSYTLKRVINATGTILHTNLGRARLSDQAVSHVIETALNYSNLEYDLEKGERGSRHSHVENLIKKLTGAESAMIVNNNAAAVFLVLRTFAAEKEVIVSRGQLVEIGGSFRISSIMEESGAKLIEVGTTNKTHLFDYVHAINVNTSIIMKVHTSNFKVIGFTESVETQELVQLSKMNENIIFYEDLGSGALFDFQKHGIGEEPIVSEVIKQGADLVTFSGDKLLGGPQAGIIAGKKEFIDQLKKHQLARVLRVDKMTLAALEGTLLDYARGEKGIKYIPTIRDLLASLVEMEERVKKFISKLKSECNSFMTEMIDGTSKVGGGTMPEVNLPSKLIALRHPNFSAEQISRKLRNDSKPSIIGRIQKDEFIIDLRTVTKEEEDLILAALVSL